MSKLLRDNKVLLQKIKKNTLLSDRCAMMSSSVGFAFSFKVDDYVVTTNRMTLYFRIPKDAYTWVEYKGSAFLCVDTSKLFTFNNIAYIRDDCEVQYKDFIQYTSKVVNDFVTEVFYLGGISDDSYMVKFLQHCGIGGVNISNLYDYINDTNTYNLVLEVVLDEIRTFLTDVIYENLNTDNLYKSTGEDTKGVFFINNTHLPLMRYDTKSQKVHTPNNGYIYNIDLMSRAGSGKDGRVILSIDDVLRGRFGLTYFNLPSIVTDNDYDIPLGGAF